VLAHCRPARKVGQHAANRDSGGGQSLTQARSNNINKSGTHKTPPVVRLVFLLSHHAPHPCVCAFVGTSECCSPHHNTVVGRRRKPSLQQRASLDTPQELHYLYDYATARPRPPFVTDPFRPARAPSFPVLDRRRRPFSTARSLEGGARGAPRFSDLTDGSVPALVPAPDPAPAPAPAPEVVPTVAIDDKNARFS